jgi:hypothetical protein
LAEDRRIPEVVRNFKEEGASGYLSFIGFKDWIAKAEAQATDWIVVARSKKENDMTDLFTFSAMCREDDASVKTILSRADWEINTDFGFPSFSAHYDDAGKTVINYNDGMETKLDGLQFRPFVFVREFHTYKAMTFELVQNFILYHEAFFVTEKSEFQRIDSDSGEIYTVAKLSQRDKEFVISVDAHHLKDYLAANKSCLVRYHDHRRWGKEEVKLASGSYERQDLVSEDTHFELTLRNDIHWDDWKISSRLLGKDVVHPYDEPDKSHTSFAMQKPEKQYVNFIVGVDNKGSEIVSTCEEAKLSNYFTDRKTPHFLTPVFFKREILAKYFAEPSRYKTNAGGVSCLDLWNIPIDITGENLVQVWLGDLGRIPYKEQLYWRVYNVRPKGTITKERFLVDFEAQWAQPTDPVYHFHVAFEEAQHAAKAIWGGPLFKPLIEQDEQLYETIHLPVTDEWNEFEGQVLGLAKITVDSLNVDVLSRESGATIDNEKIKGSLGLLEAYLIKEGIAEDVRQSVLSPLHAVQTVRSSLVAHRKSSEFEDVLKRYDLSGLSSEAKVKKIIVDLTFALSSLAKIIRQSSESKTA